MPNHLSHETSPYLLQHADKPVDWYPWSEEALAKAKAENKPIFLSIGYAACHWCHVMAHESFEDEDTAQFMNENFVNIKVDREERPDIDGIYMQAVIAMTGSGGYVRFSCARSQPILCRHIFSACTSLQHARLQRHTLRSGKRLEERQKRSSKSW
jgi:hypothetical protein